MQFWQFNLVNQKFKIPNLFSTLKLYGRISNQINPEKWSNQLSCCWHSNLNFSLFSDFFFQFAQNKWGKHGFLFIFSIFFFALLTGLIVSSTMASAYSVLLIAIDRFLYIVKGMQYQRYIYPNRARLFILLTWILGNYWKPKSVG